MTKLLNFIKKYYLLFKLIVLIGFLYTVFVSGNIDLNIIKSGLTDKRLIIVFLLLTFAQQYLGAIRAQILIDLEGKKSISAWKINQITWAASFISCIVPTSVASEIYKINTLIKERSNNSKDDIIYMSIFTKLLTIISLIVLTLLSFVLFSLDINNEQLYITLLLIIGTITIFFSLRFQILKILQDLYRYLIKALNIKSQFIFNRAFNFKSYYIRLFQDPMKSTKLISLSLAVQLLNIISFLCIIYFSLNIPISKTIEATTVIPTGIFVSLLPISIQGLGTGNFAFSKLLESIGINNGSDMFTIYFAMSYIFNLLGVFPFLLKLRLNTRTS